MSLNSEPGNPAQAQRPCLEFCGVKKAFSGREVLRGVSFSVPEGSICFVLGTSGTGKSVLLKCVVGLNSVDSGAIRFFGEEIQNRSEHDNRALRSQIGMVFQQPALFDSLSLRENLAFGLKHGEMPLDDSELRVKNALEAVGLESLQHDLNRYPPEFSYGQQKRLSLARTLALNPRVLLFDEPTTGLDPVATKQINRLIRSVARQSNSTCVVVSHDMECAAEIADWIVVLDRGEVVEQGPFEALLQSPVELVQAFLRDLRPKDERGVQP